jgi:DNA-binding CsgD family transcriptional regulator
MNDQRFDALVGNFYRAATGDISWDDALDGVQQAFGARAAQLQTVEVPTGRILDLHRGGPNLDEAVLDYVREYHQIDPRRRHALSLGPAGWGQWVHCQDVFDPAYVQRNPFYQHFLPAYETRYNATVAFEVGPTVVTGFGLELPMSRGPLNPDEREWARRLGLHMQDALKAHQRVRRLAAQALAGHGLLSSFAYPMWLLDAERCVHYNNAAAEREAERSDRIVMHGSHLRMSRQRMDQQLSDHLRTLLDGPHGGTSAINVRLNATDAVAWLHLSMLIPERVLGAFGARPMILATLFDPQEVPALDAFALARLLKLTPAQARVAARLAEGLTAEQIARQQGTTISTVRTHIRDVLSRLGAQRVADVVRMLCQGEPLWSTAPAAGT